MGTISDKLMRIINTKEDIRQALISKGYHIPTSIPFKEYAKMILDLPCKVDDFPKLPGDVTRWHFGGLTNEMMAAMDDPRIEDADGKGRFLSFKNFAWKEGSGISDVYPGFILGDGVDDFAVTEKELNFEDTYTVYTAFIPLQNDPIKNMIVCGKDYKKDFYINYGTQLAFYTANSTKSIPLHINQFTVLLCKRDKTTGVIKNLVTGESFQFSVSQLISNPGLYYLWRSATVFSYGKTAIAGQTICNGYFSTDEDDEKVLDWYKKQYPWLFPDQAWTVTGKTNEDEDRATIANITGNGNDLVLSNFAFSGNSGYGSYVYNFNDTSTWIYYSYNGTIEITSSTIHVTEAKTARPFLEKNASSGGHNKVKIKVTGIKDGEILKFMSDEDRDNTINIEKDGIYSLPGSDKRYYGFRLSNSTNTYPFNCDITIEQIPEYEGYLVTDGVDDIASSNTIIYEADFTFIGEWKFIQKDDTVAGINSSSHLYIQNRYNRGATVMINSTFENKKNITDYMTFKAITSKGKAYDENWNEVDLLYGDGNKGPSGVNIGGQGGTQFCHMIFKNMALYMNKVFSKDDCIKAYNYLQTLKAK